MSNEIFEECLAVIIKYEGGFVNHPEDPGGITNLGITKKVYENHIGHSVTEQDMRNLTESDAEPIYKTRYWDKLHADKIPEGLSLCVFDFGVNAGIYRGAKYLQRLVGANEDSIIGPNTLALVEEYVNKNTVERAIKEYQAMRRGYYKRLHHFPTFGRGWLNRVDGVEKAALDMV